MPPSPCLTMPNDRSEADVLAVRREQMAASYRAEGFSEDFIAAHATDDLAGKMLNYERQVIGTIYSLFGPR